MHEDPPIAEWEDANWHPRAARLIDEFIQAREAGADTDELIAQLRPRLQALTAQQREWLAILAERRAEGPYDHAAEGLDWGAWE